MIELIITGLLALIVFYFLLYIVMEIGRAHV